MRLISCYIENFGGLSYFSFAFHKGLNVIMEENGWGKTTLAAFLKAMFYGLERTTKQKVDENERKKYEPWNGGVYGGNLVFETDEKRYRIERFFGGKDKADTFVLYDEVTGLATEDYSNNIGTELFGIDRNAFEQSIFMKQGEYKVVLNDSLNVKMSGLMASGDDLDCYEKACLKLENEMKIYKSKIGNKGKIAEVTEEIAELTKQIARCKETGASGKGWNERLKHCKSEEERLIKEREMCRQEIKKAGEAAAQKEKIRQYRELLSEKNEMEKRIDALDSFFKSGVPGDEELECCRKQLFLYSSRDEEDVSSDKTEYHYPELTETLRKMSFTEDELQACERKWKECNEKKQLLQIKQAQLGGETEQYEKQMAKSEEQNILCKRKQKWCIIGAVCGAIAAIILFIWCGPLYSLPGILCMLLCIGISMICSRNRGICKENELQAEETIKQLQEECETLQKSIIGMQRSISSYFHTIHNRDWDEIPDTIAKVRLSLLEIRISEDKLLQRQKEIQKKEEEKKDLRNKIIVFLKRFYPEVCEPEDALFKEIEQKRNEYIHVNTLYEEKCLKLQQMGQVEMIEENNAETMDDLQNRERLLERQSFQIQEEIRQITQRLAECEEAMEKNEKLEMDKRELEEVKAEYTVRYQLLAKTLKCMQTAQTEFSTRYIRKLNHGFAKYADLFRSGSFEHVALDVKLTAKGEENGTKREMGYYSRGFRETLSLCSRLALIEALFEKEEPFVVLDDPFVNLDEKSLHGAGEVLRELAGRYQLIYFTCHSSRILDF